MNGLNDHEENVKSFALAGFSFNDIEDEGPNSFEESRIQVILSIDMILSLLP